MTENSEISTLVGAPVDISNWELENPNFSERSGHIYGWELEKNPTSQHKWSAVQV